MRVRPRLRSVRSVARTVAVAVALAPFLSVGAGEGAASGFPGRALAAQEREEAGADGAAVPGPTLPDARFADARGDLDLALTGDAILTRPLSPHGEPAFLVLREIIRGATAAFTNLEVLFHDYGEDVIPAAVPSFRGGELAQVRLHPVTLGPGLPRPVRGRPMLADREHGREILERLRALSEPYGTEIAVEGGVGVIRP